MIVREHIQTQLEQGETRDFRRSPDKRWLHTEQAVAELREALAWAKTHAPEDADVDVVLIQICIQ